MVKPQQLKIFETSARLRNRRETLRKAIDSIDSPLWRIYNDLIGGGEPESEARQARVLHCTERLLQKVASRLFRAFYALLKRGMSTSLVSMRPGLRFVSWLQTVPSQYSWCRGSEEGVRGLGWAWIEARRVPACAKHHLFSLHVCWRVRCFASFPFFVVFLGRTDE